nr:MAG TPA: Terminase small subunit [Caudoviricetes sp.]
MNCSFWTFCRLTAFFSFLCFAGCFQRSHLPFRAIPGRLFCTLTTREVVRMTDKQARFCEEYMIDLNATQAAIRAGYSPKTANEQAARLLANVSIQNRIAQLQAEQSRRTGVSADRVLRELAKVAFVNAGDLIDARTASLKSDAAPDDLAAVQSVKVKTFGEDGLEQEVKLADKLKALDLLGRHLGMFSGVSSDASDQLAEARKILGGVDSAID